MAIPASKVVKVIARRILAGGNDLSFTGLFLTKSELMPYPAVLSFDSKDAVGNFFGLDSEEYDIAATYFLGYNNSFTKPQNILFARRVNEAISGFVRGASISAKLRDFQSITEGSLAVEMDGNEVQLTGMDFSPATSLSSVGEILQTYLQNKVPDVKVTYSSLSRAFMVTSGTTGEESSVSFLSPIEGQEDSFLYLLKLQESDGGLISVGAVLQNAYHDMVRVVGQTQNFVPFTTVYEATEEEVLDLADWSTDQEKSYLYVGWSESDALKSQTDVSSVAIQMEDNEFESATLIYGSKNHAAFLVSIPPSINWDRTNAAINTAFKNQDGLVATITDGNEADILLSKNVNYYGRFATRNDDFIFLYNGCMFGDYKFIDSFINDIWLRNALQVATMAGLTTTARVPYTNKGYAVIRAWMNDPIQRALRNGVIEPGVELSNIQKAELMQEIGSDVASQIYTDGYYLKIVDPGATVRAKRQSPEMGLWYTYGGSVNKIELPVTSLE